MGAIGVIGIECKKIYDFLENVMSLDISVSKKLFS
jgi:hypothetical protein